MNTLFHDDSEDRKKIAEEWTATHPEFAKKAYDELIELLKERPHDATDLGSIRIKYKIPKPIGVWMATYEGVFEKVKEPSNPNRSVFVLVSRKNDSDYWKNWGKFVKEETNHKDEKLNIFGGTSGIYNPLFFVGVIRLKNSTDGFLKTFVVSDVVQVSNRIQRVKDIELPLWGVKLEVHEGDFVVGCNFPKSPFLFYNQQKNSAVQLLHWSSFKESVEGCSAKEYFSKNQAGTLTVTFSYLIGNRECPGHVIIQDGEIRLKGFSSIGNGVVTYANVESFRGDFDSVARENQFRLFEYNGNKFGMLIPLKKNPYFLNGKHAVIDREEWKPLEEIDLRDVQYTHKVDSPQEIVDQSQIIQVSENVEKFKGASAELESTLLNEWDSEEIGFLNRLKNYVARCGFIYTVRDLVRLHTSVKSGFCTLLAGNPGTGKSSLVELYSRALMGKGNETSDSLLRVDVNSSWMEPADLLGYENGGAFRPAVNGLYTFLHSSAHEKQKDINIVCLEEINLARVEHYFSDFIQVFSRGGGKIRGFKMAGHDLEVGRNLRFLGTCNFDESTHAMSDRFYDRVNVLELYLSADKRHELIQKTFEGDIAHPLPFEEGDRISLSKFVSWIEGRGEIKNVLNLFDELTEPLEEAGLIPSGRVLGEMAKYIQIRPPFDCRNNQERELLALDEQIAQRIIAKVQVLPSTLASIEALHQKFSQLNLELAAETLGVRIKAYQKMVGV